MPATPCSSSAPRPARSPLAIAVDQGVQLAAHLAEQAEHGVGVRGHDLAVEAGVAGGHPGHVAHALAAERQVLARARRPAGRRPARPAGAARATCARRPGRARPGSSRTGYGAAEPDQLPRPARPRPGATPACGRDGPRPAVEERGRRGQRTGALAAGHRVAADVPLDAGHARDRGERAGLHAADVGDDRVRCRAARARSRCRGGRAARRPRPAAGGPRAARGRPAPSAGRRAHVLGDASVSSTSRPARRQASAIEVPSRPAPTTSTGPVRIGQPSRRRRAPRGPGSGRGAARRRRAGRRG